MMSKKTLEVNPTNAIIKSLRDKVTADKSDKTVCGGALMVHWTVAVLLHQVIRDGVQAALWLG
jgi:hypothetical protein